MAIPRCVASADEDDGLLAFADADQLERITAPTLILWGDRDTLFPGEEGQQRLVDDRMKRHRG